MLLLLFQQATGAYAVSADVGAYALAGQDAGLVTVRVMTSDVGAYALAGQDAVLTYAGGPQVAVPFAPYVVPLAPHSWSAGSATSIFDADGLPLWSAGPADVTFDADDGPHSWRVPRASGGL